ncbi:MAG: nucleotidyltransferase substrate binding protein [Phycisphaerae bacterium]|nr:nucleotidyltransferase substrate binding protein [Phycisphaerae bacterium]
MNDSKKDIRWQQRFDNFEKAYLLLANNINLENPTVLERAGIIQFFEMAFELSWKLLKDYLQIQGFDVKSPRETIKQAFQTEIILDGHCWIQALDDRNITTHTYDEQISIDVTNKIKNEYCPILKQLYLFFRCKK